MKTSMGNNRLSGRLGLLMQTAIFIAVGVAGAMKSIDVDEFRRSLLTWSLIPRWATGPLSLTVPVFELALCGAWICGVSRRLMVGILGGFLIAVTGLYSAHLLFEGRPQCACFGLLISWDQRQGEAWHVLGRNGALIAMLLIGTLMQMKYASPRAATAARGDIMIESEVDGSSRVETGLQAGAGRHGFALVELLVCIGVIGILISFLFPAIAGIRDQARRTVSLANVRQHLGSFQAYGVDWKDHHPWFTSPRANQTILRPQVRPTTVRVGYFMAHSNWHYALADVYYNGDYTSKAFSAPYVSARSLSYYYGCAFIARPPYWDPRERLEVREQWGPTRADEVLWPSRKAILAAADPLIRDLERIGVLARTRRVMNELGFCDGSAASIATDRLTIGYAGDGVAIRPGNGLISIHNMDFPWAMHTMGGVRGQDVDAR